MIAPRPSTLEASQLFVATLAVYSVVAWAAVAPLLAFSLAFFALAGLPYLSASGGDAAWDPFRPHVGLALLVYLYSVSTLLFVAEEGLSYYGEPVSPVQLSVYTQACLLCIAGLSVGAWLAQPVVVCAPLPEISGLPSRRVLYSVGVTLALALSPFIAHKFAPWSATSYADVALSTRVENLADQAAGLKEVVLEQLPVSLLLAACAVALFDIRLRAIWRMAAGTFFLLYVTTALLSGWRGHMMFAALTLLVVLHWTTRPLRLRSLVLLGVAAYVLVNALSVARVSADPIEMVAALAEDVGERGLGFLALRQSGELATSTNLLRLIAGIEGGESDLRMGRLALGQLAAFLPRVVLPDRPPLASELFVQSFYPGVFEAGGGYGFFLPQDGYWDFGLAGVFAYAVLLGMLLEAGYGWFRRRRSTPVLVLLYAALYSQLVLAVVRSGMFASLKAALISALPLLLLILVHRAWLVCWPRRVAAVVSASAEKTP